MARSSFNLPGLGNIVQKLVPNHDNGTITVSYTIKGVQGQRTFPFSIDQFDQAEALILSTIKNLNK